MNFTNILFIILLFLLLSSILLALIVFSIVFLPFLFWGAVYLPTNKRGVTKMIELADIKPGDIAADLGSGDGRLVIALAEAGAEAHGYEINPFLVWLAKRNIRRAGFESRAFIHFKSFWRKDFSEFDIITVYGISHIMRKLEVKLNRELNVQAKVISNCFIFPTWPHSKKDGGIYLYKL